MPVKRTRSTRYTRTWHKTTISSTRITVQGQIETAKKKSNDPVKQIGDSLHSRRGSGASGKSVPVVGNRTSTDVLALDEQTEEVQNSNAPTRGATLADRPGPSDSGEAKASGRTVQHF